MDVSLSLSHFLLACTWVRIKKRKNNNSGLVYEVAERDHIMPLQRSKRYIMEGIGLTHFFLNQGSAFFLHK